MIDLDEQTVFESIKSIYLHKDTKKSNYKSFSFGHFQIFMII